MNKKLLINNIKHIINQVVKENLEAAPNDIKQEVKVGLKGLFESLKDEFGITFAEFANISCALLAKYTSDHMNENNPKPAPTPSPKPGPSTLPGKPAPRPGPREPLFPPDDNPDTKPKAKLKESDIIKKIEQRFNTLKHA